jgi:signal transduction histidine kinase
MALGGQAGGETARVAVADVVGELRALCDRLRPAALDAFGLPAALASLADRAAAGGLDVRFAATDAARAIADVLPDERRLALYRIAQEALSNACQHARAARIDVALALDGESLVLAVDDDGAGPPSGTPMDYAARGHYGLLGMHERADLLRATLDVGPGPLGGTRVALTVPVRSGLARPALVPTPSPAVDAGL